MLQSEYITKVYVELDDDQVARRSQLSHRVYLEAKSAKSRTVAKRTVTSESARASRLISTCMKFIYYYYILHMGPPEHQDSSQRGV